MQIKNMKLFRQQYKKQLKSSEYNENYVGAYNHEQNEFGYFSLIHGGAKMGEFNHDFGNFLQAFLEMASDGQAVYEFLQNAVDVQSSQFFIRWGQLPGQEDNYVLVINNGRPFSEKDIKSILNIGMSTKAYVNKGEQHTIGKFGIGFKLAHRLVGESNGLNELVNEYHGPILFSWHNDEWKTLAEGEPLTLNPTGDPTQNDTPWFFKILMTCFPCLPGEEVFDVNMNQRELFSSGEVKILSEYLRLYRNDIGDNFRQGSMFFIRLGRDKEKMLLADSLDTGVRFSTAILNRVSENQTLMDRVVMNQHTVVPPNLNYWTLNIDKQGNDRSDFYYILYGNADHGGADTSRHQSIQMLMGYTDHQLARDMFRDVPNLYLFFPLSEEKHNFNFILHSNAFYMASSRTKLHEGTNEGGINHRLFEVLIRRLSQDLQKWFDTDDNVQQQQLLTVYPNLLLADLVQNTERAWVNNSFIIPLHQYLTSHIPVRDSLIPDNVNDGGADNIQILSTQLPLITTSFLPSNVKWFYWSPAFFDGDERLCDRAIAKLGLSRWTVMSLLEQPDLDVAVLSSWFIEDVGRITLFLREVDNFLEGPYRQLDKRVEGKLSSIKLFAFRLAGEVHYFSLSDLNTEVIWSSCLLRFANMTPLEPFLTESSVGFVLSDITLADYPNIYTYLKTRQIIVRYLGDFTLLNKIMSGRLKTNTFAAEEKAELLKSIEKLTDVTGTERDKRIDFIELYKNQLPDAQPTSFRQLISPKLGIPDWLKPLEVKRDEYQVYPEMERYTTRALSQIYESIILPNWHLINQNPPSEVAAIYKDITDYYVQAPGRPATLTDKAYLFSDGQWLTLRDNVHYNDRLKSIDDRRYNFLRSAMQTVFGLCIPDVVCLEYLDRDPFRTTNQTLNPVKEFSQTVLSKSELSALLSYCQQINFPFFDQFVITQTHDDLQFRITASALAGNQYHHTGDTVRQFVAEEMWEQYSPLPLAFVSYQNMVTLRDDGFLRQIIYESDGRDEQIMIKLCRIVGSAANAETSKSLLDKIGTITLILDHPYNSDSLPVQALNLWGQFKDEYTSARRKIYVQDQTYKETLDIVTLRGANLLSIGTCELPINDILTGGQNQQFAEWVSRLLNQFEPHVDQPEALRGLLNLNQTPNADQVYAEMETTLSSKNYILQKPAQIAFIILYRQIDEDKDIRKWLVYDGNDKLRKLEGIFYVSETSCSFISPENRLDERYTGLATLLSLDEKQPERKVRDISIRCEPVLESNATLNLSKTLGVELSPSHQLQLLTWYYDRWHRFEKPLDCHPQNTELATLLGFDPRAIVLNPKFACQYVDSKEKLPPHIAEWINDLTPLVTHTRLEFMRVLGAHRDTSPVVVARKYMAGLSDQNPSQSLNPYQSFLTLRWLEEQETTVRVSDNARKNLLSSFYQQVDKVATSDLPLPQLHPNTNTWQLGRFDHKPAMLLSNDALQIINEHHGALASLAGHMGGGVIEYDFLTYNHQRELLKIIESNWYINNIDERVAVISPSETEEYDRPFYQRWRTKNDYQIYKVRGGIPMQLKVFDRPFFYYSDANCYTTSVDDNVLFVPDSLNDEAIIEYAEIVWGSPGTDLLQEFQQLNQYILNLFSNPNAGEEIRRLQERIEHQREIEDAKQIVNNPDSRYTLAWFQALIDLEQKLSNRVNLMNDREGSIDFSLVEPVSLEQNQDQLLLRLSHSSRAFSQNIESYGNFVATVEFTRNGHRQSQQLSIKGVSKKGQTLLALVDKQEFYGFDAGLIHRVGLTFSQQINFLATLDNNYDQMGLADDYNFKDNLTPDIQFVFGPPGTGKTTHLSRFILEQMRKRAKAKLLVLTPTNKAADVLASRILKEQNAQDGTDVWLARYGTTADQNLIEEGYFYDSNSWTYRSGIGVVLITTIHRFLYEQVSWGEGRVLLNEIPWETIVMDEASMIPLSYMNFVLHKCRNIGNTAIPTEFVIGGDPFQLPPVVDIPDEVDIDDSVKEENIYTMVELRTFDPVEQAKIKHYGDRITNLDKQFRSIRNIGELFSQFQYGGRLEHNRINDDPRPLPAEWRPLSFLPVTCLRFTCNNDDTIYRPQRLRQSPYHLYSAQVIAETVRWMSQHLPATEQKWTVGVVTPYRAQAQLINKLLETVSLPVNLSVVADTVHGFQGDECDMVFVVLNPPNHQISGSTAAYINKNHLINVAISRARDYLILMYPDDETMGIHNLKLIKSSSSNNSVESIIRRLPLQLENVTLHTSDIEQLLFESDTYLQEHTFTHRHQMVNVYGRPTLHFTVRSDENALDIQVRMSQ